ncbi:MAG: hypothetical protein EXQ71_07415 [Acidimicrobiia bacterium]|nr:hypothetical protein [Acidimicrobiia bacterium]
MPVPPQSEMNIVDADETGDVGSSPPRQSNTGARIALGLFIAYLLISWWWLVFEIGPNYWFFRDDWAMLVSRDGGSLRSVMAPFDVHPIPIPVVIFRLMFNMFGLNFIPYHMLLVTLHLGVALLLRIIMRRAGVGPWIASAAAATLVLFGHGGSNIIWVFQITNLGSILFVLIQLILVDHDGPLRRRDALAVLAGIAACMCSGLGLLLLVPVGLVSLARRGWRYALLQTGPAALTYLTWNHFFGLRDRPNPPAPRVVLTWMSEGLLGTGKALGHLPVVAILLALLLVGGLGLLVTSTSLEDLRRTVCVPGALLIFVPLFFALLAVGRSFAGIELAQSSRYLYTGAVCALPALAVAGDAVARRWRPTTVAVVLLFLAGFPGNIRAFDHILGFPYPDRAIFDYERKVMTGIAMSPQAKQVPRWVRPLNSEFDFKEVTVGFLLDMRDQGFLPPRGDLKPQNRATIQLMLGLIQIDQPFADGECKTQSRPLNLSLVKGETLGIISPLQVALTQEGKVSPGQNLYLPDFGQTLSVESPSLEVRFAPLEPNKTFTLCR